MPITSTKYFDYDPEEIEAIFPVSSIPTYTADERLDMDIRGFTQPWLLPHPPIMWILNMPEMIKEIDAIMPECFNYDETKTIDCDVDELPNPANISVRGRLYREFEFMRAKLIDCRNNIINNFTDTNNIPNLCEYIESRGYDSSRIVEYKDQLYYIINKTTRKTEIQPFVTQRVEIPIKGVIAKSAWVGITLPVVSHSDKSINVWNKELKPFYNSRGNCRWFQCWNFSENYTSIVLNPSIVKC